MEALTRAREAEDKGSIATQLNLIAELERRSGNYWEAISWYLQAIQAWSELGNRGGIARCLEILAFMEYEQDQPEQAARLLGAAEAVRQKSGSKMLPAEKSEYDAAVNGLQEKLGVEALQAALADGHGMTVEQALRQLSSRRLKAPTP
jgi:hypothetical protein